MDSFFATTPYWRWWNEPQPSFVLFRIISFAGLVQRAILLSGSALSPWAHIPDPDLVREQVSQQMACHLDAMVAEKSKAGNVINDITPCLKSKPLQALMGVRLPDLRCVFLCVCCVGGGCCMVAPCGRELLMCRNLFRLLFVDFVVGVSFRYSRFFLVGFIKPNHLSQHNYVNPPPSTSHWQLNKLRFCHNRFPFHFFGPYVLIFHRLLHGNWVTVMQYVYFFKGL